MKIKDALKILDKWIIITLNEEVDYTKSKVVIDGAEYAIEYVYDARRSFAILEPKLDAKSLIGKQVDYIE